MTAPKNKIIQSFDKAANSYDEHAKLQRVVADRMFAKIKSQISNNQLLLDGGCGTGYFHELLRKNKIYCPLIQADISFKMCERANEYASPPEYGSTYTITADIEALPIVDAKIDMVFSSLTLQWADFKTAISEIRRTLKPAGTLAFSTIGNGSLVRLSEAFATIDNLPHINENFMYKDEVEQQLQLAGFKNISISEESITQYYDDIKELMHSIKGVGASYKSAQNRKYLGKNYFRKLEETYREKFAKNAGLPLDWNIIYGVATK